MNEDAPSPRESPSPPEAPTTRGKAYSNVGEFQPNRSNSALPPDAGYTSVPRMPTQANFKPVEIEHGADASRFSVRELLLAVSSAALLLGLSRWLSPGWFAGISGTIALAMMAALAWLEIRSGLLYAISVTLLVIYLIAIIRAVLGGMDGFGIG